MIRLAKLYQVQNFDASNAVLLAEWIKEEFKHKPLKLIIDTLNHPPVTFEEGQVSRNWRLTPDTVYLWIDKRAKEAEESRQLERTRSEQPKLLPKAELSPASQEMINGYIQELGSGMFQSKKPIIQSERAKQIDLLLKLLGTYRKESFDPITGKLKEGALDEREWLLEKGYFIEKGEIKEI